MRGMRKMGEWRRAIRQVTAALAKALAVTDPGSAHARLLAAALLARAQVPTVAAVGGQLVVRR
jgi:hypothetical protein